MILLPEHFVPDQFHVDGPYEVHPFTENKSTKYPHSEDLIELSYLAKNVSVPVDEKLFMGGMVCGDCIAECSGIVCEDRSVSSFDSYCEMREPVLPA